MEKAIMDTTDVVIHKLNNMQDEKAEQTDKQFKALERDVSQLEELFKASTNASTKPTQFLTDAYLMLPLNNLCFLPVKAEIFLREPNFLPS